ncbi:MAG: sigma-70 family RNA polymerase sigma factor [Chloroflexi bacterium]|nr:sigma-70 family RNA polymerase sigma factor [Chloroflexota bacterium]
MSPSQDVHGERAIIDAAIAGDEAALAELYNLYFPRVYRYILARMGNPFDAEDLTEEVFLRVLDAIGRFQWREAPFSAWLFRIAHNAVISQRRKEGARGRSSPLSEALPVDSQGPEEMVANRLALNEVMRAADTLPEAQRRVIGYRFAAGLTVAETARAMGKGEGNVKVIQHKAIAKLREMLTQRPKVHGEKRV